ncbi:MAG: hypothetical protein N838_06870 [Thiohalocapsa sp. PB-PSB1]|jgi:hypothetical protein|nr:MAG: hypothetical protein N838_06870 [Thiohalocapsa sp. PB-PSB1]
MRLIELSANRESYRPLRFNPEGPSSIAGRGSRKDEADSDNRYNGVGKLLAIALSHFHLGSNEAKAFQETKDWNEVLLRASGRHSSIYSNGRYRSTAEAQSADLSGRLGRNAAARVQCSERQDSAKSRYL